MFDSGVYNPDMLRHLTRTILRNFILFFFSTLYALAHQIFSLVLSMSLPKSSVRKVNITKQFVTTPYRALAHIHSYTAFEKIDINFASSLGLMCEYCITKQSSGWWSKENIYLGVSHIASIFLSAEKICSLLWDLDRENTPKASLTEFRMRYY